MREPPTINTGRMANITQPRVEKPMIMPYPSAAAQMMTSPGRMGMSSTSSPNTMNVRVKARLINSGVKVSVNQSHMTGTCYNWMTSTPPIQGSRTSGTFTEPSACW